MKCIVEKCNPNFNEDILKNVEKKYSIKIRKDIHDFFKVNHGGCPIKSYVTINEEEYEIRIFLSVDERDQNYSIKKSIDYFLNKYKTKIIPIGIDSGDNYYCVNNENGNVYYWSAEVEKFYHLTESLEKFVKVFM